MPVAGGIDGAAKSEILLALTAGESPALGNIWRITAKKSDFYLDTVGPTGETMHISLHGPQSGFDDHRFHLRIDHQKVATARREGHFVEHLVPRRGKPFSGRRVTDTAFQVVRLRWLWDLQRARYREAAVFGDAPDLGPRMSGMQQKTILRPNGAWDVDLYISYGEPYWPFQWSKAVGDPRLGPLRNESGHWLTGHSFVRSQVRDPSPSGLVQRLPSLEETPNRLTCGGLGPDGENDMYWFVETITARELLEAWGDTGPLVSA